jgi:hypothetical protein
LLKWLSGVLHPKREHIATMGAASKASEVPVNLMDGKARMLLFALLV